MHVLPAQAMQIEEYYLPRMLLSREQTASSRVVESQSIVKYQLLMDSEYYIGRQFSSTWSANAKSKIEWTVKTKLVIMNVSAIKGQLQSEKLFLVDCVSQHPCCNSCQKNELVYRLLCCPFTFTYLVTAKCISIMVLCIQIICFLPTSLCTVHKQNGTWTLSENQMKWYSATDE